MTTSSSSIHSLSLLSYLPNLKTHNSSNNTFIFHNAPIHLIKLHQHNTLSLKPLCFSHNHSSFSIPPSKPTTSIISSFLTEKLVLLLAGSFLLMGCLCNYNNRPVFAIGTQKFEGKGEDGDMYEKLLENNPRDVKALKVIFHERMRKGKTDEAVLYVERLIDVEPGEVEWRLLQALCYEMMGHFTKAKRLFKDILAKRPLLLRALHGLAMVMHKNHEGPVVFEMLNKALKLARREKRVTEERNIRILIAQIHVVKGDLEEGLKHFQALVDENPRDFRPYLCQGIIYSLLDKKNEAEKQFELYRSLVPDEFPQRGFLDDVVLAAKTSSHEQLEKDFQSEYSTKIS